MKKKIIILILFMVSVMIMSCSEIDISQISDEDLERISEKLIVCNEPYIRHGADCCLDTTKTGICDLDEINKDSNEELVQNRITPEIPQEDESNNEPNEELVQNKITPEIPREYDFTLINDAHSLGSGKVIMINYMSATCPFSARHHTQTFPLIKSEYIDTEKITYIYKHFIRTDDDILAANALECAGEQNKFFEYLNFIYENQHALNQQRIYRTGAEELNLDIIDFNDCFNEKKYTRKAQIHTREAQTKGITSTPGFLINSKLIIGAQSFNHYEIAIETELTNTTRKPRDEPTTNTTKPVNETDKLIVYYFWGDGCPFCDDQKPYLDEWEEKYSDDIIIKRYETWRDSSNVPLLREVAEAHGVQVRGVPATFIGERNWAGFASSMANDMESYIKHCIENGCESLY